MLNLIPPEIKQRHKTRSKLYSITVIYIVIAALFILGPIALATYQFVQNSQITDKLSEIDSINAQIGQSKDVSDKLAFIESRVSGATSYQEQRSWDGYLKTIASSTPTTVQLTSITLDDGKIAAPMFKVAGKSSNRRSIVLFKDKLTTNELISAAVFENLSESSNESGKVFLFSLAITFKK
ncbi:MAG: PilN domain-containing protein [Patescibacteria group bacterium]